MPHPRFGVEFALTDVTWFAPNAPKPRFGIDYASQDQEVRVGDEIWIYLASYSPALAQFLSLPFWALFEHWTTHINGFSDAPENLDRMRLVLCKPIPESSGDEQKNLFSVRCLEVLAIDEIPARFAFNEEPLILDLTSPHDRVSQIFKCPQFTIYAGGQEGIVWYWIVTNQEPHLLVTYGFFLERHDKWEICNRPFILKNG